MPPDPSDYVPCKLYAVLKLCGVRKLYAEMRPNRQVPWCFLIFQGETLLPDKYCYIQ